MALPTEKTLSTRLLLLVEIHNQRHAQLRPLAVRLGVTVQAVSHYLKRLGEEGLVERVAGAWKPTPRGTAQLHAHVSELRRFLDDASSRLRIIDETLALAGARIRAGDDVGLYLDAGRLHAAPRVAARSRGRAKTAAHRGELVVVEALRGILELRPAPITLIAHPDLPAESALRRVRREIAKIRSGGSRALVAVHDVASIGWAQRIRLPVDLEFAPLQASLDAARRGLPVAYLVSASEHARALATLRETQTGALAPVPLRSVDV